jgi:hypothetical protein
VGDGARLLRQGVRGDSKVPAEYRVIADPDTLINQQLPALYNTGWKPIMKSTAETNGHHVITVMLERPPQAHPARRL